MAMEIALYIFVCLAGLGFLKIGLDKNTFAWQFISAIIFLALIPYSFTMPFSVDSAGATMVTSSNVMLTGISMILMVISFFFTVQTSLSLFKSRHTSHA
jgi:hypothetical protein